MRFGTVYLGIWASIAFQIWAFTKVRVVVRRSMALFDEVEELSTMEDSRKAAVDAGRRSLASAQRLFAFPLIILIARGVGTINRIHNWVNPGDDVAALYYLRPSRWPRKDGCTRSLRLGRAAIVHHGAVLRRVAGTTST